MPTPDALGPILEQARIDAGLTQVQLAHLLGTSRWNYNRVVNGHAQFNTEWIMLLPLSIREPVVRYLQRRHDEERAVLDIMLRLKQPERREAETRIKRPTGSAVAAVV